MSMARIMKRKSAMSSRKKFSRKIRTKSKRRFAGRAGIARVVSKIMNKKIETKMSNIATNNYRQIEHNNLLQVENTLLKTTQGTADPMASGDVNNRIGDEITLKGISLKFMLELNERYSDVTFRIMVVRTARGDVPTSTPLFTGLCDNKMLDTINKERFTVIAQKYTKLVAPNASAGTGATQDGAFTGIYYNANTSATEISRATKIVRMYIPGTKFARNGVIKYENGGTNQKFFDYYVLVYAYANQTTSATLGYNVGAVSCYTKQMFFTDA